MKNLLIVESENDKFFVEALIRHINLTDVEVSKGFICSIDDFECLEGLSLPKLITTLKTVKLRAKKDGIEKIGVIIDLDDKTIEDRLTLVNEAIQYVFGVENTLGGINNLYAFPLDEHQEIKLAAYFNNIDGRGELETVLKAIKNAPSTHADCLHNWQLCLQENHINDGTGLKDKDFDKFWVQVYIRFDTCTKNDRSQAGKKCNLEAAMQKPIWNFDHEGLSDLKTFLRLFQY